METHDLDAAQASYSEPPSARNDEQARVKVPEGVEMFRFPVIGGEDGKGEVDEDKDGRPDE